MKYTKTAPLYRQLLVGAWEVTWHRPWLWIMGIFAAILGNSGALEIIFRGLNSFSRDSFSTIAQFMDKDIVRMITVGDPRAIVSFLLAFALFAVVTAFLIWFSIISFGGILYASRKIVLRQKVDIKESLGIGIKYFWRLFSVIAISKIIIFALFLLLFVSFVAALTGTRALTISYIFLFLLVIIAVLFISFLAIMAGAGIVQREKTFGEAVFDALTILRQNWLISIEMVFLLFLINVVGSIVILLSLLILTIPFFLLFLAAAILQSTAAFYFVFAISILTALAVLILGGAILTTFQYSAWALLYMRLLEKSAVAKLSRIFSAFLHPRKI